MSPATARLSELRLLEKRYAFGLPDLGPIGVEILVRTVRAGVQVGALELSRRPG